MNRFFIFIIACLPLTISAATIYWDGGGGDGLWSTSANWTDNLVPGAVDDVILNGDFVSASYTVTLPAGNIAVIVNSLLIAPAGSNTIMLVLPNTNTSFPGFTATGSGDAITLNNGAILKNSSGAPSGTPVTVTATNFFRINNGGRYIHNTPRGHTDFLVSRLSTAPGTEMGIFEFDVPGTASYTVSASNRIYGSLLFSASAAGVTKTYTASGTGAFTIRGNLEIQTNATLSYGANTNELHIGANCSVGAGGTFNISNGATSSTVVLRGNLNNQGLITETGSSTATRLELCGVISQQLSCTGSFSGSIILSINNAAGIVLTSPFTISHVLQLTNGKIKTTAENILILTDNANCTAGSALSFIEGPVRKIGDDFFDFPVGVGAIYAPIGISGIGSIDDVFTAEYRRANPQSSPGLGNTYQSPIHHISSVEYWILERNSGNSGKIVKLNVSPYSFAKNFNTLSVARFGDARWNDEGGSNFVAGLPTPPYVTGSFTSSSIVNSFGSFTIATTDEDILNPLPLRLISFNATIADRNAAILKWELNDCCLTNIRIDLEKSNGNRPFSRIASFERPQRFNQFTDPILQQGPNRYRLKFSDIDGSTHWSHIVTTLRVTTVQNPALSLVAVQPSSAVLHASSTTNSEVKIFIADQRGMVLKQQTARLARGSNTIQVSIKNLAAGVYLLWGERDREKTNVVRFLKR